jgi:hypothetical protein
VVVVDVAGAERGGRLLSNALELVAASTTAATATDPTTSPA